MHDVQQSGWRLALKKTVDKAVAAAGLVACAPIMAATAAAIYTTMGRPVLFRQQRPGLRGRPFEILKFRTMLDAKDASGSPLPDDQRMTPLGTLLRATSIDELPQLVNVLRGELSLVGPRPLLMKYLPLYTPDQARRHDVMPGITGWCQVHERNAATWPQKFERDVWYVDHWSLWLDAKILAMTVVSLLAPRGISQPGHVTMPDFAGES